MLVTWQLSNEIKWPLLQGTPIDYCTPHYIVQLPTIHSASPISIYLLLLGISLLQCIPPIARYTPYYKVYPLLQGIPPITRYTPYYEVYPLLRGIPPITRYTPYCEVYPLLRGIPPIARYICTIAHKIYPLFQSIPPVTK